MKFIIKLNNNFSEYINFFRQTLHLIEIKVIIIEIVH